MSNISDLFFRGHLDEDEKIIVVIHRHPIILFNASLKVFFFGVIIPVAFYFMFPSVLYVAIAWGIGGFFGMLYHIIDWYFDVWLITNTGVIDIDKNGLFEKSSTRIEYHMIEGIAYTIKGFWATVLNYGDIQIDKISTATTVILHDAASPKRIERQIMKYQEEYVTDKSIRDHNVLKNMLAEMLSYHMKNNKIKSK
ncbi:MAG: hypothetical protein WC806_01645 [Candidatus Gracilibacteria bacterium]|jgi:hypothetical protein